MENKELIEVASRFDLKGNVDSVNTLGEGFINDTFIVTMSDIPAKYILQKKNKNIFKDVPGMMDNIVAVTEHLKRKIVAYGGNPLRETLPMYIPGRFLTASSPSSTEILPAS